MLQQQNAFAARASGEAEVDDVALHALSLLAATRGNVAGAEPAKATIVAPRLCREYQSGFYDAAVSQTPGQLTALVAEMQLSGVSSSDITSMYVPAIARQLGEAWVDDTACFSTVTIASARLQTVVRQLEVDLPVDQIVGRDTVPNCLVVVPEGAQHTLGAIVLTAQLRHAGTPVTLELEATAEMLSRIVDHNKFDAVMISASQGENLAGLNALSKSARRKGSDAKVFIGGNILQQSADLASATDADYATNDWQEALDICATGLPLGLNGG